MSFKVAAVHAAPVFMDKDASIAKAIDIILDAGRQDIKLLVFPEAFIPGYPLYIMSHPPFQTLPLLAQYAEQSMHILDPSDPTRPSADALRLASACREANLTAVLGVSERSTFSPSTLFNSQLFLSPTGSLLGAHRKLQPTFAERAVWAQGSGATLRCWDVPLPTPDPSPPPTPEGRATDRLSGLVCAENRMPTAIAALALAGEGVHAASWPAMCAYRNTRATYEDHIRTMAKAHANLGSAVVVAAGGIVGEGELGWVRERLGEDHAGILCEGNGWSGVVDAKGRVVAEESGGLGERLVVAEVGFAGVGEAKVIVDPAGHYSRPEVLRLEVKREGVWPDDGLVAEGGAKADGV